MEERRNIFRWNNFSYFEDEALNEGERLSGLSFTNSEITLSLEAGSARKEALLWLISNAKFSSKEQEKIKELLETNSHEAG